MAQAQVAAWARGRATRAGGLLAISVAGPRARKQTSRPSRLRAECTVILEFVLYFQKHLFDNSMLSLKFNLYSNFEPTREFVHRVVKYIEMLLIILILRLFFMFSLQ